MASRATETPPERSAIRVSAHTTEAVNPTESQIAALAYQIWLACGCPIGADQEHWFRAEAMLKNALVAKWGDLSRRSAIPRRDTLSESEMVAEFTWNRWEGHWEVWESEWGGARWVWDVCTSDARILNGSGGPSARELEH